MTPPPDPLPSREPGYLHKAVHDRIRDLLHDRAWYRAQRSVGWRRIAADSNLELHCLLRLARAARRQAEADAVWHLNDAVTLAKAYHDRLCR